MSSDPERLASADSFWLDADVTGPSIAIGALTVVDGPAPTIEEMRELTAQRLPEMERLRQRVEHATILYGNTQLKITISAGVFHVADPVGMSVDDLVKVADEALYEAKAAGRNCVVYRGD